MTIKRRLFISNIMMLLLPIIISVCIISFVIYSTLNYMGILPQEENENDIYDVVEAISLDEADWTDIDEIFATIDSYSDELAAIDVSIAIYENGEQIYLNGYIAEGGLVSVVLQEEGQHYFAMDTIQLFKIDIEDYSVVVRGPSSDITGSLMHPATHKRIISVMIFIVVVIVMVVFVVNWLLTRLIIKSIINPLDTLVYGVRQIRDGNLDYRINYRGKDEFAGVCDDFNDMAQRLSDMVEARQKDDENRRELIAGISHDLRTPLTSIKAYVEGLEKGVASTPELRRKYLETIRNKAEDLEHIVSQLFLFSKIDIGDYSLSNEPIDIGGELAAFVAGVAEEYAGKGLGIELTENSEGLIVNADSVQLRAVFTNLLENSVKYGAKDGGLMLVSCRAGDGRAIISWRDNGPGVEQEALERIFDIFYRGDKARSNTSKGSGLGLAISARMMGLMGGGISAYNADDTDGKGHGLVVELTLPMAEEDYETHTDN